MADNNLKITYKGSDIVDTDISTEVTKTLKTSGKYCEGDIIVTAQGGSGGIEDVSTAQGMDDRLTPENNGKMFHYTGATTSKYGNDRYYLCSYQNVDPDVTYGISPYGWRESTDVESALNLDETRFSKIYQSENKGYHNTYAVAKVEVEGAESVTVWINSFAEANYDYTILSDLDAESYPTIGYIGNNCTIGFQKNPRLGLSESYWRKYTYTVPDLGKHYFYIVYRKDLSTNANDDRGYFVVEKITQLLYKEYLNPKGNLNITDTLVKDVSTYKTAQVADLNLQSTNIRKDISILGIVGSYEGGGGGVSLLGNKLNGQQFDSTDTSPARYTYNFLDPNTYIIITADLSEKGNYVNVDGRCTSKNAGSYTIYTEGDIGNSYNATASWTNNELELSAWAGSADYGRGDFWRFLVLATVDGATYDSDYFYIKSRDSGCIVKGTLITLTDGSYKPIEDITYDDVLLVWDFDNGCFATAKPLWLKKAEATVEYNYLKFSDGNVLKTVNQHRIFNKELGKFTYPMTDETPVGTTTMNDKGEFVQLVEKKVIKEVVEFYNIITEYHINCFAGGVLTSNRFSNLYPIEDMKYVKDNRELVSYDEYSVLDEKWFTGLRLSEQPKEINRGNDDNHANSIIEHIQKVYIAKEKLC